MKDIKVCYGIDVDCVAGWLGSYGGEDSPCDISRGVFAGRVGIPRLLDLFDRYGIKTTWFSCGHSIETFPEQMKDVVARGHEIGLHGYSHENPLAMTPEQEEKILGYCNLRVLAGEGEVQRIAVHPESRRLGLGRKMMDAMVEYAIREGAYAISLEVREGNLAARNLYESYGFAAEAVRKAYYHNPTEDALIMWKRDLPERITT